MKSTIKYLSLVILGVLSFSTIATQVIPQNAQALDKGSLEKLAKQYTVRIRSGNADSGSGFIIKRVGNRYTVATAFHVMHALGQDEMKCSFVKMHDGEIYSIPKNQIKLLKKNDLAIFEFESPKDYPVAQLSDYQYPLLANRDYQNSASESKVLTTNKQVNRKEFYVFTAGYPNLKPPNGNMDCGAQPSDHFVANEPFVMNSGILMDASGTSISNPEVRVNNYEMIYSNITAVGMSGGPVIDPNGRVVGMHGRADGKELTPKNEVISNYLQEAGDEDSESAIYRINFGMSAGVPVSAILRLAPKLNLDPNSLIISKTAPNTPIADGQSWRPPSVFKPNSESDNVLYWLEQANQQWRVGQLPDAQKSLDQALALDQRKKNSLQHFIYFMKGFLDAKSENYSQALENCGKSADSVAGKDFYEAWRCKSSAFAYLGQFASATNAMNQALRIQEENIKKDPNRSSHNPSDYAVLAEFLWKQGQYQGALKQVEISSELRREQDLGESADLYNLQATILISAGQYDEAIQKCDRALAINPSYSTALVTKGHALQKQGQFQAAEVALRQATTLDPRDSNAWNNLGYILTELGRLEESLPAFEQAVKLDPKNVAARQNRDDIKQMISKGR
jgi:tetratricopeptide (TPR) repeat protein